jgi:hypothetical protein
MADQAWILFVVLECEFMCLTVRSMRIMEQLDQDGLICKLRFLGEDEMVVKVEFYNILCWCSCTWGHLHSWMQGQRVKLCGLQPCRHAYVKLKFLSIDYKCKHLINSSSYQKHVEHGQLGSLRFDNWAVYCSHHSLVLGLYMSAFVRGGAGGRKKNCCRDLLIGWVFGVAPMDLQYKPYHFLTFCGWVPHCTMPLQLYNLMWPFSHEAHDWFFFAIGSCHLMFAIVKSQSGIFYVDMVTEWCCPPLFPPGTLTTHTQLRC